jgi:hypothetical protein
MSLKWQLFILLCGVISAAALSVIYIEKRRDAELAVRIVTGEPPMDYLSTALHVYGPSANATPVRLASIEYHNFIDDLNRKIENNFFGVAGNDGVDYYFSRHERNTAILLDLKQKLNDYLDKLDAFNKDTVIISEPLSAPMDADFSKSILFPYDTLPLKLSVTDSIRNAVRNLFLKQVEDDFLSNPSDDVSLFEVSFIANQARWLTTNMEHCYYGELQKIRDSFKARRRKYYEKIIHHEKMGN